jgi:RNA-directed DNA polymerase
MNRPTEIRPVAVPERARRAGEILDRWDWVEPRVWTERMLTALEEGVKGGKWFSLIDKVIPQRTLEAAFREVAANRGAAGVDHVTIAMFEARLDDELRRLSESLRDGTYRPQAIRRHYIPKPGSQDLRPLGIPTVRDRTVQTALRMVLEPIFERDFAEHSYGFRPGRGCKDALSRVDELLKAGYVYVVDADLKSYFDTIPHDRLMALVGQKVSDGRVLSLIEAFLKQGVLDGLREWTPEMGSPQGAVITPPTILQKAVSWRQSSPERGSDRDTDKAGRQAGSEPLPVGTVQEGVIPPWRDGPAHDARLTCFGTSRRAGFRTTCCPPSMTACSPPAYRRARVTTGLGSRSS